ncbi:MAG: type II toxin-antitoxin system VapC family toxin [Desulfobacteraceae bacterium]|nr:type II toxin-antitoxin system VapC family toxin [Desulfobacteraceae bacterium]
MNFVSDTNILLAVIFNEPEKDNLIQLTSGNNAIAPEILPYEVGNALSAMLKRKQITTKEALQAQKSISSIPVRLISIDISESLKISIDYNIYAYDAYFLQCAISQSCPLLTLDKGMKNVAKQLNIQLLE